MDTPKKTPADTVSTAVRLERRMVEWLKEKEGGVADGLKRGIDCLIYESMYDQPTRAMTHDIKCLAQQIEVLCGAKWHDDVKAFDALAVAIKTWLEEARPTDTCESKVIDDPSTLGRTVAKMLFAEREQRISGFSSGPFYREQKK